MRIADADRVRLGAHLAEGTTVMHEGFVNFNAGTLGASMVEGRISRGRRRRRRLGHRRRRLDHGHAVGRRHRRDLDRRALPARRQRRARDLARDDCIVEAGLYVTGGTRVTLPDGEVVKALELSGADGLLFRRNSQSGAVEAMPRSGSWAGLNAALHAND